MSCGERSCIHYGKCDFGFPPERCNVDCVKYRHDGIHKQDTVKSDETKKLDACLKILRKDSK